MKKIKVYRADAFTKVACGGNPAGVVPYADELTEEEMQAIAREMNCSETAFVLKSENPQADFHLRFFTPSEEVELCGHATIAAFHVLVHEGLIVPEFIQPSVKARETVVKQETKAGILKVHILWSEKGEIEGVIMEQALPEILSTRNDRDIVAEILGLAVSDIELEGLPMQIVSTGLPDLMVPIKNLAALKAAAPNFKKLAEYQRAHGFISIHAFTFETENSENRVHVRDFAPSVHIDEESATGTANGALGAYLIINRAMGAVENPFMMKVEQGSEMGRPSQILLEIEHRGGLVSSVKVGGRAIILLEGYLSY